MNKMTQTFTCYLQLKHIEHSPVQSPRESTSGPTSFSSVQFSSTATAHLHAVQRGGIFSYRIHLLLLLEFATVATKRRQLALLELANVVGARFSSLHAFVVSLHCTADVMLNHVSPRHPPPHANRECFTQRLQHVVHDGIQLLSFGLLIRRNCFQQKDASCASTPPPPEGVCLQLIVLHVIIHCGSCVPFRQTSASAKSSPPLCLRPLLSLNLVKFEHEAVVKTCRIITLHSTQIYLFEQP